LSIFHVANSYIFSVLFLSQIILLKSFVSIFAKSQNISTCSVVKAYSSFQCFSIFDKLTCSSHQIAHLFIISVNCHQLALFHKILAQITHKIEYHALFQKILKALTRASQAVTTQVLDSNTLEKSKFFKKFID